MFDDSKLKLLGFCNSLTLMANVSLIIGESEFLTGSELVRFANTSRALGD